MTDDPRKFFHSTSPNDKPILVHVSFFADPKGSLGAQLQNCDGKNANQELFLPGFAVVGKLIDNPSDDSKQSVARQAGVQIADVIVAVNGQGFRRFAPDYQSNDPDVVTLDNGTEDHKVVVELDHAVATPGSAYTDLLTRIKAIKAAAAADNDDSVDPLILTLERYSWDARPNAWMRFLAARDDSVPDAMQMIQQHEQWKQQTFPIRLLESGLQKILRTKAVSEIDIDEIKHLKDAPPGSYPPTVYVNYGKLIELQSAGDITSDDVVQAFLIFTERMLDKHAKKMGNPRNVQTCQFIDLSNVSITSGFRVETLKKIYNVFEPNYPETLYKMVMYPVSSIMVRV